MGLTVESPYNQVSLSYSYYPQVETVERVGKTAHQTHIPTTYFANEPSRPTIPSLFQNITTKESIDPVHQLRPSILNTSTVIMHSPMRECIQEPQAGSPGASSTSSFQDSSSLSHAEHILSPLKVERTRGIGRSRSMIVEVSVDGGRKSSPQRRRGSLTFAVSINALPRAGSSRRRSESPADSIPQVPQRYTRRASMF